MHIYTIYVGFLCIYSVWINTSLFYCVAADLLGLNALVLFSFSSFSETNLCVWVYFAVYSLGCTLGSLECLHHLLLSGCRRPVKGETSCYVTHISAESGEMLCTVMNAFSFFKVMAAGWQGRDD